MRTFEHPSGLTQRLAVADLTKGGADKLILMVPAGRPVVVYGDPPWSAGNEKYWRRYAKEDPPVEYTQLLDGWCRAAAALNPLHIFCEQSSNEAHYRLFVDAAAATPGWHLPLLEQWDVAYGSGKSRRPNLLLHFSLQELMTDPTGMNGPKMTRKVFDGIDWQPGTVVVDPCMGLGMTSRLAHERGLDCVGTELNAARLDKTIAWLLKKGYVEKGGVTNTQRRIDSYNKAVSAAAAEIADICADPALRPQLLPTAGIKGNDYNPNKVACPELDLLELSIREDGVTMAVVVMPSSEGSSWTVIDGFHRRKVVSERLGREFVPCTVLHKTDSERMASTVRHNRARGKHHVDLMAVLVKSMLDSGMTDEDTAKHLGMTIEEFLRLRQMVGAAKILATEEYSRSWGLIESS